MSRIRTALAFGGVSMLAIAASATFPVTVLAQQATTTQTTARVGSYDFNIPSKSLIAALADFTATTGIQIIRPGGDLISGQSPAVSGRLSSGDALSRILASSGMDYQFTDARTVTIRARGSNQAVVMPDDGSLVLDTITVTGRTGGNPVNTPYETAAPTSHISAENIERFRGSSPADIFRGTPGVMSGEARNGAGAVDVNIRGMQGMGRVATSVDGAENGVTVYQGYQGLSNRTYVDPDLIAGIDITKGSDASSRGIAGTVAMRTLNADDIVKDGEKWGVRVKGGFGTNTSSPNTGALGGYAWPSAPWAEQQTPTATDEGLDRPAFLRPTSGSSSIVAAVKEENFDLLAGYAYRSQGNYHAGSNGPSAAPVNTGPRPYCYVSGYCPPELAWKNYYDNSGISNYRAGEEVLNTALQTQSWLAKATLRLEDGHSLQLGYTGYRGEAGDRLASGLASERSQAVQQEQTVGTKLDTITLRHRWEPDDNDLIDLKSNLWLTNLEQRNPPRNAFGPKPDGLPEKFRSGSDTRMWGGDIANTSRFFSEEYGSLDLTYGLSYLKEDTRPSEYTNILEGWLNLRDAERQEAGAFTKLAYKPVDWLTLNTGLRYSNFWSHDRGNTGNPYTENPASSRSDGGFSPSVGVTVEPFDGTQLYVNYSNAMRFPSLFESVSAFTIIPNPDLSPERSSNWEIGTNFRKDGLFADDDTGMIKLGYFNWNVKDYISRSYREFEGSNGSRYTGMQVHNIDRARFSGLELSGRYEIGGLTAELAANYYLDVEFCRTADSCENKSLYADYATNHVPPKYTVDLTVSQKLFEDRVTLGGRISHIGPRAIGHGDESARGASSFISQIKWKPYTLVDVFAEYKINDNLTASGRIENLTDQYYVDPLGLVNQPGPGRTFYASLTGTFGGSQSLPALSSFNTADRMIDWSGIYAGVHFGADFGHVWGTTTALDGTAGGIPATESFNQKPADIALGGQIGYNWQLGNRLVLGVEADLSKTYMSASQDAPATEQNLASTGDISNHLQARTHYDIDWTASLRGRVGYAFDNRWLAYGTGGIAFLKESLSREQYRMNDSSNGTEIFSIERLSGNRTGWTVGAGAEYAINDRWSVKGDYTYSRFGSKAHGFSNARAGVGRDYETREQIGTEIQPPNQNFCDWWGGSFCEPSEIPVYETTKHTGGSNIINGRTASNALDLHSFKVGLNYRF